MKQFFIDILAFTTLLSSVLVITSKNPIHAIIFLISVFVNSAGYLILMGIGFIGIAYIIVYVGAITILFLFVVMMVNIKLEDILEVGSQYTKNIPLAIAIGSLFLYEIFSIIPFSSQNVSLISTILNTFTNFNGLLLNSNILSSSDELYAISPVIADSAIFNFTQIEAIGHTLYTNHAILLILMSIILLLAMIAPIFISARNKSESQINEKDDQFQPQHSRPSGPNLLLSPEGQDGPYRFAGSTLIKRSACVSRQRRAYHSLSNSEFNLNPWLVTGLVDAEGCFAFSIKNKNDRKLKFEIRPTFFIFMHIRDLDLLIKIRDFFNCGVVRTYKNNQARFEVENKQGLTIIINHFKN